jgi:hypothetical protein
MVEEALISCHDIIVVSIVVLTMFSEKPFSMGSC